MSGPLGSFGAFRQAVAASFTKLQTTLSKTEHDALKPEELSKQESTAESSNDQAGEANSPASLGCNEQLPSSLPGLIRQLSAPSLIVQVEKGEYSPESSPSEKNSDSRSFLSRRSTNMSLCSTSESLNDDTSSVISGVSSHSASSSMSDYEEEISNDEKSHEQQLEAVRQEKLSALEVEIKAFEVKVKDLEVKLTDKKKIVATAEAELIDPKKEANNAVLAVNNAKTNRQEFEKNSPIFNNGVDTLIKDVSESISVIKEEAIKLRQAIILNNGDIQESQAKLENYSKNKFFKILKFLGIFKFFEAAKEIERLEADISLSKYTIIEMGKACAQSNQEEIDKIKNKFEIFEKSVINFYKGKIDLSTLTPNKSYFDSCIEESLSNIEDALSLLNSKEFTSQIQKDQIQKDQIQKDQIQKDASELFSKQLWLNIERIERSFERGLGDSSRVENYSSKDYFPKDDYRGPQRSTKEIFIEIKSFIIEKQLLAVTEKLRNAEDKAKVLVEKKDLLESEKQARIEEQNKVEEELNEEKLKYEEVLAQQKELLREQNRRSPSFSSLSKFNVKPEQKDVTLSSVL